MTDIDYSTQVSFAGISVPGFRTRSNTTTVELPSGGSVASAGLISTQSEQALNGFPALMNVPVLGALFRSRDYLSGETELVVIVEAYLAKAGAPDSFQTPADGLRIASDLDTVLLGRLNKAYKGDKAPPPPAWQGPVGYVIE